MDFPHKHDREIPELVHRFSQSSRAIPVAVSVVFIGGLALLLGWCSWQFGEAFRDGRTWAATGWGLAAGLELAAVVWVAIPSAGGRWLRRLSESPLRARGHAKTKGEVSIQPRSLRIAALAFGFCIVGQVGAGLLGWITPRWQQPISALYLCPFFVFLYWVGRPTFGKWLLIWPLLYGVHGILVSLAVPMPGQESNFGSMGLPVIGYGVIAALFGYLQSRWIDRHLRRACREESR